LNAGVTFPAGWTTRRPTLDDVPEILAMVHASDVAAVGEPDFSADDVREALDAPHVDMARDSWLAYTPDGRLAGWSYFENPTGGTRDSAEVYTHPEHGQPAQAPLIALALRRAAERATELGHPRMTVRAAAIPTEKAYIDALKAAGYAFVKRYARMRTSLDGVAPQPPQPPAGVAIRTLRHDDEADLRTFHRILDTAFRDTPDYAPQDYDAWQEKLGRLPSITWDEWFVASVDGTPAGILQSADQALESNEGWVKNLAVLRDLRRRGVGEALLRHAFAVYAGKGRAFAGLGVDLANPTEAVRLYHAVGMTASFEADIYEREVDAG
jgi:mycothiol synthase